MCSARPLAYQSLRLRPSSSERDGGGPSGSPPSLAPLVLAERSAGAMQSMTERLFAEKEIVMLETVTTNGATILVQLGLWSSLVWAGTYMYMARKVESLKETINFLDIYIEETEANYGHVIDDYIDHYYSDGEWVEALTSICLRLLSAIWLSTQDSWKTTTPILRMLTRLFPPKLLSGQRL